MSTGKRLGGKEAAAKGRFLNHLNFGYAKHIKVREKPSEDALEQMLRTNISKEVIDRYCNGIEFDCMSCMVHAICMKNLNGGQEIYSDIYCQSPVTFGKKDLLSSNGSHRRMPKTAIFFFLPTILTSLPTSLFTARFSRKYLTGATC